MKVLRRLLGLDARDVARSSARAELIGADELLAEARASSNAADRRLELLERRASVLQRRRRSQP